MAEAAAPHHEDPWLTVYGGDARDVLPTLPDASVHCVVTSPPYWGLRDYGIEPSTWGGDPNHDHEWGDLVVDRAAGYEVGEKARWNHRKNGRGESQERILAKEPGWTRKDVAKGTRCACGAWRGALGLEPTPEEYVANLVAVFREVRRVLRDDGTLWLNLGDSYASNGGDLNKRQPNASNTGQQRVIDANANKGGNRTPPAGLKPKDLVGIPWRVAFALQADGWYLRSDIIWSKPNPMPESVTDRPTKAHEYLFLLAKRERYYFDQEAVREGFADERMGNPGAYRWSYANDPETGTGVRGSGGPSEKLQSEGWNADRARSGRNLRSVWTIATRPYPGAHFAVFPPELPERCIKAGCPENGVVLDPFAGSGTVGLVANRLSRRAVLIDLNPAYLEQQMKRNAQVPIGL